MSELTLYEQIQQVTRTMDFIIERTDIALEYLEDMKKDGVTNWRIEPAIRELKDIKNNLGRDVF